MTVITRQIFHNRLLRLLKAAHHDTLCSGCIAAELLGAAGAIIEVARLDTDTLTTHGIPNLALAPGTLDTPSPNRTTRH